MTIQQMKKDEIGIATKCRPQLGAVYVLKSVEQSSETYNPGYV